MDENTSDSPQHGLVNKMKFFFKAIQPIIWSHHPICKQYSHGHTIHIGKKEFCIGCFIGYPIGFFFLIIGNLTGLFGLFTIEQLFHWGLLFNLTIILSIFGLTKWIWLKIFTKATTAIGLVFWIMILWSIPLDLFSKILWMIFFLTIVFTPIQLIRGFKMYRICMKCEFKANWETCPGLSEVFNPLKNLLKIKKKD